MPDRRTRQPVQRHLRTDRTRRNSRGTDLAGHVGADGQIGGRPAGLAAHPQRSGQRRARHRQIRHRDPPIEIKCARRQRAGHARRHGVAVDIQLRQAHRLAAQRRTHIQCRARSKQRNRGPRPTCETNLTLHADLGVLAEPSRVQVQRHVATRIEPRHGGKRRDVRQNNLRLDLLRARRRRRAIDVEKLIAQAEREWPIRRPQQQRAGHFHRCLTQHVRTRAGQTDAVQRTVQRQPARIPLDVGGDATNPALAEHQPVRHQSGPSVRLGERPAQGSGQRDAVPGQVSARRHRRSLNRHREVSGTSSHIDLASYPRMQCPGG